MVIPVLDQASEEFAFGRQADPHEAFMMLTAGWLAGCVKVPTSAEKTQGGCHVIKRWGKVMRVSLIIITIDFNGFSLITIIIMIIIITISFNNNNH